MPFYPIQCCIFRPCSSADGILANPEKVDMVKNWPVPKSAKMLHSFLSLVSYYKHFILNFSHLAQCLHSLVSLVNTKMKNSKTKKASSPSKSTNSGMKSQIQPFEWTEEHQASFDALKHALTIAPVLSYPDFSKQFVLETNTSLKGLGAVLSQVGDDGKSHVISYASRSLHPPERSMQNYNCAKLELLALKWAMFYTFCFIGVVLF